MKKAYLCDQKQCRVCSGKTHGQCFHTFDETHAKYKAETREWEQFGDILFEKERSSDEQAE